MTAAIFLVACADDMAIAIPLAMTAARKKFITNLKIKQAPVGTPSARCADAA